MLKFILRGFLEIWLKFFYLFNAQYIFACVPNLYIFVRHVRIYVRDTYVKSKFYFTT